VSLRLQAERPKKVAPADAAGDETHDEHQGNPDGDKKNRCAQEQRGQVGQKVGPDRLQVGFAHGLVVAAAAGASSGKAWAGGIARGYLALTSAERERLIARGLIKPAVQLPEGVTAEKLVHRERQRKWTEKWRERQGLPPQRRRLP
jgi:hypothetical protein